jgi:membrane-associated phospholipid phosphatase
MPSAPRHSGSVNVATRSGWLALCALIGFIVMYLVAVQTTVGQRLDQVAMLEISSWFATAGGTAWAEAVLAAVSAGTLLLATGGVLAACAALRGGVWTVVAAGAAATVVVLAQLLKSVLDRPELVVTGAGNSFPSGHVAAVCGLAVALIVALPRALRWPAVTLLVGPTVLLTGLATVVLLWHRPSDVVGSILLAIAVGAVALGVLERRQTAHHEGEGPVVGAGQHHRGSLVPAQSQPAPKRGRIQAETARLDLQSTDAGAGRPLA